MTLFHFLRLLILFSGILFLGSPKISALTDFSVNQSLTQEKKAIEKLLSEAEQTLKDGEKERAQELYQMSWKNYIKTVTSPHTRNNVIQISSNEYQNAQIVFLREMKELYEKMDIHLKKGLELEAQSYWENRPKEFSNHLYSFLPTKTGFMIFDTMGSKAFEEGDFAKAAYLWELARDFSPGYNDLPLKHKNMKLKSPCCRQCFLTELATAYSYLGWQQKLDHLLAQKENSELIQGAVLVSVLEKAKKYLDLHSDLFSCPSIFTIKNKIATHSFFSPSFSCTVNEAHIRVFLNAHYLESGYSNPLIFDKPLVVSNGLAIDGRIFVVIQNNDQTDLSLLTIEQATGKILNHTDIARIRFEKASWQEPDGGLLKPYTLYPQEGKIFLHTERSIHEFDGEGNILRTIARDLKEQEKLSTHYPIFHCIFEGTSAAEEAFLKGLKNPHLSEHKKIYAIGQIGALGTPNAETISVILPFLKDENHQIRLMAAETLGDLPHPSAIAPLIHTLKDDSSSVRKKARNALVKIGKPALPFILEALDEKSDNLREELLLIFGSIGIAEPKAIPKLLLALEDKNHTIRGLAAWTLGKMENPQVIPILKKLEQEDKSTYVKDRLKEALKTLQHFSSNHP